MRWRAFRHKGEVRQFLDLVQANVRIQALFLDRVITLRLLEDPDPNKVALAPGVHSSFGPASRNVKVELIPTNDIRVVKELAERVSALRASWGYRVEILPCHAAAAVEETPAAAKKAAKSKRPVGSSPAACPTPDLASDKKPVRGRKAVQK